MKQAWTHWVGGTGTFLVTVGIGFAVHHGPPFVQAGDVVLAVGLACVLVAGWVDFGRKC